MKKILLFILCISSFAFYSQNSSQKAKIIYFENNKLITEKQANEYISKGFVKSMNQGIPKGREEEYLKLIGDKVVNSHNIITIVLLTKEEKAAKDALKKVNKKDTSNLKNNQKN